MTLGIDFKYFVLHYNFKFVNYNKLFCCILCNKSKIITPIVCIMILVDNFFNWNGIFNVLLFCYLPMYVITKT